MSFIKKNKVLFIILSVILVIFLILCILRFKNMSAKQNVAETADIPQVEQNVVKEDTQVVEDEEELDYQSSLSIKAQEEAENNAEAAERLEAKRAEEERKRQEEEAKKAAENAKPNYGDEVLVWGSDGVPDRMVDGTSIKSYFNNISLSDFDSKWGTELTNEDKLTEDLYLVGVDQNEDDYLTGYQSESFGWLIDNLSSLDKNSAIKFTDLNVVGSLSDDHVALLTCYNWYSVWGLKETLLMFEDVSGTLKVEDFKPGTIFSAYTYVHNIKLEKVNGQTVICVQYNTFK